MNTDLDLSPIACTEDALPVVGQAPLERADAARNRERVLAAAARLFAERGVDNVSMDAVAAAAGVGKGTLFRRFGDRPTLVRAVLSSREERFQDAIIRGPAPLGPGPPAIDRLIAFGTAYVVFVEHHVELLSAAEFGRGGARYRSPVYGLYLTHLTMLVREADSGLDAEYVATVLMGTLAAELVRHLRQDRGMSGDRVADGWRSLVTRLLAGDRPGDRAR